MMKLSNEAIEKSLLDRRYHVGKRDKENTKGLCGNSMLQVHGCIRQENIIVSINPSFMDNFININLAKRLQIHVNNIQST